jgi:hypothetical protein
MAESNPPVTAVLTVTEPELLRLMLMEVGEALTEKLAAVLVTVSETVALETVLPEVPVSVIEYVPVAVVGATVKVTAEEPAPVMGDRLKPTVTPVGWPEAVSVMAESNPPLTVLVTVEEPELP